MWSNRAGSYLRLIDACITQLKAQYPSRTCHENKEEDGDAVQPCGLVGEDRAPVARFVPLEQYLSQGES